MSTEFNMPPGVSTRDIPGNSPNPGLQPETQAAPEKPAVPCASMQLPNGWTLGISGPTECGEVWVTFSAPKPAGMFASHWVPADGVRGKVMLELMRSMQPATLPPAIVAAQIAGDVIASTGA